MDDTTALWPLCPDGARCNVGTAMGSFPVAAISNSRTGAPRTSPLPAPGVRPLPLAGTPGTALLPLSASGAGMPAAIELSRHTTDRLRYCSGAAPIATGAAVPHAGKSSARRCRCGGTARCGGPLRRARCCRPCSVPLLCLYGTCCVHGTITPWYTRWGVKAKISNTSFAAVVRDLQSTAKE